MSWPAKHPGPWRCEFDESWPAVTDWPILDANGEAVVVTDSGCYPPDPETSRFIVDAANFYEARRHMVSYAEAVCTFVGERHMAFDLAAEWIPLEFVLWLFGVDGDEFRARMQHPGGAEETREEVRP